MAEGVTLYPESVVNATLAERDRLADIIDRAASRLDLVVRCMAELKRAAGVLEPHDDYSASFVRGAIARASEAREILAEADPVDPETGEPMGVGDGR